MGGHRSREPKAKVWDGSIMLTVDLTELVEIVEKGRPGRRQCRDERDKKRCTVGSQSAIGTRRSNSMMYLGISQGGMETWLSCQAVAGGGQERPWAAGRCRATQQLQETPQSRRGGGMRSGPRMNVASQCLSCLLGPAEPRVTSALQRPRRCQSAQSAALLAL